MTDCFSALNFLNKNNFCMLYITIKQPFIRKTKDNCESTDHAFCSHIPFIPGMYRLWCMVMTPVYRPWHMAMTPRQQCHKIQCTIFNTSSHTVE